MINTTWQNALISPTSIDNVHESMYKSWAVLQLVKVMLERKDSHQTIMELIDNIYADRFIYSDQTAKIGRPNSNAND